MTRVGDSLTYLFGSKGAFHSHLRQQGRGEHRRKPTGGVMMPVDKGWRMRLHEADQPSLIVSPGNDYRG